MSHVSCGFGPPRVATRVAVAVGAVVIATGVVVVFALTVAVVLEDGGSRNVVVVVAATIIPFVMGLGARRG